MEDSRPKTSSDAISPHAKGRTGRRWLIILLALVVLIAGGLIAWDQSIKHRFIARRWGMVEPGLFRSGQVSTYLIESKLSEAHIGRIIVLLGNDPESDDHRAEAAAAAKLGIDRVNCPLAGDGTGDIQSYRQAVTWIVKSKAQDKPVLVHCETGRQRTSGVIAMYQLLVQGKSPEAVVAHMKQFDFSEKDNNRLIPYLNQHMAELAQLLKDDGIIDKIPDPLPVLKP